MNSGQEGGVGVSPDNGETPTKTTDETKRTDDRAWDQYFMGVALISAQRSKDPNTQVGACIVNPDNRIVGVGYNGMPDRGIQNNDDNDKFSWELELKLLYVCHAEMNAIVNKMVADLQDCKIYTTLYPCNECSKLIVQSGIRQVVYLDDKHPDKHQDKHPDEHPDKHTASRDILKAAKILPRKYKPKGNLESLLKELKEHL